MSQVNIYHDPIRGNIYIDCGLSQYEISLPEAEYEEVTYIAKSETFRAIIEQLIGGG